MSIRDHKEWELMVESLKKTNDSLGVALLNVDATPENCGKIGELQGQMKMIHHFLNLPSILWPPEIDENEGDE